MLRMPPRERNPQTAIERAAIMNRPKVAVAISMGSRYHRDIFRGAANYARLPPRSFDVVLMQNDHPNPLRVDPDGMIAFVGNRKELDGVTALGIPVVNVSGRFETPGIPTVTVDDLTTGTLAAEHLLDCGFPNFGFYGHSQGVTFVRRREGFTRTLEAAATTCSLLLAEPMLTGRLTARARSSLQHWLAGLPKPVGIFCASDWDAWDIYEVSEELGLRIPDEVGVLGADNEELYCLSVMPEMSSIERRADRVGYEAARLMERLLHGEPAPPEAIRVTPQGVVQRGSTDVLVSNDPHVATLVRYIRDHADRKLQVKELLDLVPVSRRVIERCFREHRGCSVLDEIHRARVNRVKEMLTQTDIPIEEIAYRCQFPNVSHMTNLFRRKTGHTPGNYRKQFRQHGGQDTGRTRQLPITD